MAAVNKRNKSALMVEDRLAGGFGMKAAKQDAEALLRRSVMTCLLWEDLAYIDGESHAKQIAELIPHVPADRVAALAIEARNVQQLRHVPLLLAREMARLPSHRHLVSFVLKNVVQRPDELSEFLSIYWKDGKQSVCAQAKKGLATAFCKFNEYSLAKWNRDNAVKLRDVMRVVHPKPKDQTQADLWKRLLADELKTPDTWEVGLSAAKSPSEKKAVWERLIAENNLGANALLKNLRNMKEVGVDRSTIAAALDSMKLDRLMPIDFITAAKFVPDFADFIERAMFKCLKEYPRLGGLSVFVVDVSGSMGSAISGKSEMTRMEIAASLALLAKEICDDVVVYATAGSDGSRVHQTEKVVHARGFALAERITKMAPQLGGGGIFTRQCLEFIKSQESKQPDRIIVFSDSQDCDIVNKTPNPFGKSNYIVDVSAHKHGVNYRGKWTAEISGWSPNFLRFIAAMEAPQN